MNKSDLKLIIGLLLITLIAILFINTRDNNNPKEALVYYENNLVLTIDLSIEKAKEYKVEGFNGEVLIESKDGKVRVIDEISPLHICSYQGWIKSAPAVIVCLPNKIVIKVIDKENKIDAIVR